jgi:hypothetical protein
VHKPPPPRLARAQTHALVAFALLLGLFEGPAQLACAVALVLTAATGGLRDARLNLADVGLVVWLLAGVVGGLVSGLPRLGSEPSLRPLMALAYVLGRVGLAEAHGATLARVGLAFIVGTSVNAAYGCVQVWIADPGLERLVIGRNRARHLEVGDGTLKMATGLFYNRMKLVHVGVVALGAALLAAIDRRRAGRAPWVLVGAAVVLLVGVTLTYRRAAPAALVLALAALAIVVGRARLAALVAGAGGLALLAVARLGLGPTRVETAGNDVAERLEIWESGARLFADRWPFGVGHGGYTAAIAPYLEHASSADLAKNALTNPHNGLLFVLAETGVVGFLGFAVTCAASLAGLTLAVRADHDDPSPRATLDRVAWVALVGLLAIGVVHAPLHHAPVALVFWSMLGVASARLSA